MRIVHLLWALNRGGAESLVVDLANEQAHQHDISLLVVNNAVDTTVSAELDPSCQLIRVNRKPGSRNPLAVLHLLYALRSIRPDVVHAHSARFAPLLRFGCYARVVTVHDTNLGVAAECRVYDRVFAISQSVARELKQKCPGLRPVVVPNGVARRRIPVRAPRSDQTFRIVSVARLEHRKKGQDVLLKAVALLQREHPTIPLEVRLIGDGPSRTTLERLSSELRLDSVVSFLGAMPRAGVYTELSRSDLLVHPPRWEGFGLVVVEAMMCGLPVLVSNVDGPAEITKNGQFGHTFVVGDERACALAITRIYQEQSSPEFARRTLAAQKWATENFDVPITAERYLSEYATVCGYSN